MQEKLKGKLIPDYCIVECIKNAALNEDMAKKIQKEQEENRKKREGRLQEFGKETGSHADFLRMRLFWEQGGTSTTPAKCPFTEAVLNPSDLFSGKLQLAHIYPDTRGGLYMADNLVLTTAEVNHAMGNRTPYEAAHAALPGWLSWEEMLRQTKNFRWNDKKKELFSFIPTEATSFPDFNNITRTAQLARELKRMVAVWMGITADVEALRTRIGNPCGIYTAAASRSFLWQDYVKDRSDNRHHRIDAALMTCLPPTGLNDVLYKGIFQTEIIGKNRTLMFLQGLPIPDFELLRHDGETCPIHKINSQSKTQPLGDSTFWSVNEQNLTVQRTPISSDKNMTTDKLYQVLVAMGIPKKNIPSTKKLQSWLTECQAATTKDAEEPIKPLKLNNGTPIRYIKKKSGKGNLNNTPIGWNGIINEHGTFDQMKKLTETNDRLELWLGWNTKKKRWEYYKKLIPTATALAGLKRMGLPWRGTKNAPVYLLDLLAKKKAKDLHSMICGTLPPHAVKVGSFRKGDVFRLHFERNDEYVEKLQKDNPHVDMAEHPKTIETWGAITAILSEKKLEFKSITNKDRKSKKLSAPEQLSNLINLPDTPDELAKLMKLNPPS